MIAVVAVSALGACQNNPEVKKAGVVNLGATTSTTVGATTTSGPAASTTTATRATTTTTRLATTTTTRRISTLSFDNCTEAKAAGYQDVGRGEPGYGQHLDRDNDGIGCES